MANKLEQVKKLVESELITFEKNFKEALKSKVFILDKVTYFMVQRKGKQMRPLFVILAAKMNGELSEESYTAAIFIELLHNATLAHDDVVDDSHIRRGWFSLNALWKNKIAVLIGDYFLSRGLLLALDRKHYNTLHIFADAVKDMSEGELLQIEKARKLDIKEDVYYQIIRQKTASLIAASCSAGFASTSDDKDSEERMYKFGEYVGMAFQIKDDLFDYGTDNVGKPLGIDIKEKKMTLPLIYVLQNSNAIKKRWIKNIVKRYNNNKKKVNELIAYVKQEGGLEYATSKMHEFKDKALSILEDFPDSEAKKALSELVQFTIERRK